MRSLRFKADRHRLATANARAMKLGIMLEGGSGSVSEGRILREDLDRLLLNRVQPSDAPQEWEEINLFGFRRRIAAHMQEAKTAIWHFTYLK